MSEINGPNFSVNPINLQNTQRVNNEQPAEPIENEENSVKLTDFSNSKAEALGRSMLFKGSDDIKNDLKTLLDNPQVAENSDELFEAAYKIALENGSEHPYEDASEISTVSF